MNMITIKMENNFQKLGLSWAFRDRTQPKFKLGFWVIEPKSGSNFKPHHHLMRSHFLTKTK